MTLAKPAGSAGSRVKLVVSAPLLGSDGALPSEFQIFHAGLNTTEKGDFLFDAQAAKDVIADAERRGVRVMIDLEHLSLDQESRSFDPDARGSCMLRVKADGSLWASDVKWTSDGGQRLTERRQSYISPVVDYDTDTGRVKAIHNLALTAIPATHGAQQLVAANARTKLADGAGSGSVDPSVIGALGLGEGATLIDVVTAIGKLQAALNGGAAEPDGDELSDDGDDDGDEELDDAEMSAAGATPPPAPPAKDAAPAEKKAVAAARKLARKTVRLARRTAHRELLTKTGEKTTLAALSKVETWRSAYLTLEADREKLAKEKIALELTERKEHVTSWVKLGKEDPATAFDPLTKELLDPWASMSLEKIRERSAKLKAGPTPPSNARPPEKPNAKETGTAPSGTATVSNREPFVPAPITEIDDGTRASLARVGIDPRLAELKIKDPAAFRAELRARREAPSTGANR